MKGNSGADPGGGGSATHRAVIVYSDGGSRGNPGPAGYGAVVFASDGSTVLAERAASLGRVTNNVAEYAGVIAGLEAAKELGATGVTVRMDSKLVIEQLSGRWQVKHPDMKPLARKASGLLAGFAKVSLNWVPRAENSHADRLANEAMDAAVRGEVWTAAGSASDPWQRSPDEPADLFSFGTVEEPVDDPAAALPSPVDDAADAATALEQSADRRISPLSGATKIIVVRHGETTWGADGRFAGREDVPLTSRGRRQASSVAGRVRPLGPGVVLTSPLQRCRLTAEAIGARSGAPVVVHPGLVDGLLGEWTGCRPDEIERRWPTEFAGWRNDPDAAPPGGESFTEIRERVSPMIDDVVREYRGSTVVLVTHAATTKMILMAALGVQSAAAYRLRIDTASLSGFTVADDGATMVWAVNETGHLTG